MAETGKRTLVETNDDAPKKLKLTMASISEKDVGITEFLSPQTSGFKGQIKQRYSDFLVNEISLDDTVVHLNDKGFKMPKKEKKVEQGREKGDGNNKRTNQKDELKISRKDFQIDPESRKQLVELLGEDDVISLENVYKELNVMETKNSFDNKTTRTNLHQLIRKVFDNQLESVTTPDNHFKIANNNKKSRVSKEYLIEQSKDKNGIENWGYGPDKQFIHFTLYKENKETMDAINIITRYLKTPTRNIKFAGTKDRRGVTCQRLSISKIRLDRLNALNKVLKGIVLGGYKFEDKALNLGQLHGNEFYIAIRNVHDFGGNGDDITTLEKILNEGGKSLTEKGFINYFGMQRFGTFSVSTHEIGKILLAGEYKKACNLILADQENVMPKSREARKIWEETKDATLALSKMPRQCVAENALLFHLSKAHKDESVNDYTHADYHNALMKIPRNLRTMYVHAYQSYVWNCAVSERIKKFGLTLVPGDLVLVKENVESNTSTIKRETNGSLDENDDFEEDLREADFVRAFALSQEDIDSNKYTIEDVVLPTPGFDIKYPEIKEMRDFYVELMAKDDMNPFDMVRKVRDFSLPGSYRPIIGSVKEFEWKIIKYENETDFLINTDLEILNNTIAKNNCQKFFKAKLSRFSESNPNGSKVSVILKFQLGVSAYATMLLRELMKVETSRRGDMCDIKAL
ncbi:probable Multisubstrate pseudouridine synthase 7 [Saccharomycodes ludwigii]|uniref:Probable Multisubstrate pseudouridine synthase 7 n=1 Tax=Saccharomycodes ludwigii TaxID=36035 RepID=A0A376B1G8_9ASCO|nr:hypothetical protein SCDLUD_002152 [Saccharomycodes ludwigii]KAH3902332.1 hypothetical protein SCDLUD_002152 [Saccharomycodes ludwigii]SSD58528.1 probable Multisubstrate pseudouridine synthase 7 [Saccharomycodes ludwigii]